MFIRTTKEEEPEKPTVKNYVVAFLAVTASFVGAAIGKHDLPIRVYEWFARRWEKGKR